jgi:predicted nucleic acid-binding Zn ribbon protein
MSRACLVCGGAVERDGNGQVVSYCSLTCRRASEYEKKRLQTRLLGLESGLGRMRRAGVNSARFLGQMSCLVDHAAA